MTSAMLNKAKRKSPNDETGIQSDRLISHCLTQCTIIGVNQCLEKTHLIHSVQCQIQAKGLT